MAQLPDELEDGKIFLYWCNVSVAVGFRVLFLGLNTSQNREAVFRAAPYVDLSPRSICNSVISEGGRGRTQQIACETVWFMM
jgi:hypothetical protein